jgi:cyclic pyranopterin phosphate synthase
MLSHTDKNGNAKMVDISNKDNTERLAKAVGFIQMKKTTLDLIKSNVHKKGEVLTVAKIAGIQAAKQTSNLIPMCHPINITSIKIDFKIDQKNNVIECLGSVNCNAKTGVEMETLVAISTALLTIYDMCKAVDRGMRIFDIQLLEKEGGKTGLWKR